MLFGQSENWKTLDRMFDQKTFSYNKFWKKYPGISKSLAIDIPRERLFEVVADYCSFVVGDSSGDERDKRLSQLPKLISRAFLVYWYEAEINNGGLHQYFLNSTGYDVLDTIESLEYFGLKKNAGLLREAYELILSKIQEKNYKKMQISQTLPIDDLVGAFDKIDQKFFQYEEAIDESVRSRLDKGRPEIATK